ncbi:Transcription factor Adf-1 [Frankliniella fusca]|uniref:Transcription factor Adf-1 n=1 Tax=Frankliniella fusca TaxID=407009 RepID=A0AAE1HRC2_9NEOP|nr:Transcription factor Adf-1 [Frankliniella fusca]
MSAKGKGKFSVEEEVRLIYEVEKRPILWDATNEIYKRADLKPQVWSEVAANIGPAYSGEVVAARFKSLRDTFFKNWRKIQESKTSGSGTDDVYTPRWHLYSNLAFLKKTCTQQGSTSNIPSQASQMLKSESQPSMSIVDQEVNNQVQVYFDENLQEFMTLPQDESVQSSCGINGNESISSSLSSLYPSGPSSPDFVPPRPASAPSCQATTKRKAEAEDLFSKRGNSKKTGAAMMEEAVKVMKDICKQQPPPPTESFPTADREEIFGNYIASRLRLMTDDNKKQCENAILAVLLNF